VNISAITEAHGIVICHVIYEVQSDASADTLVPFGHVLNGRKPQFSTQIADDLMSLARDFGHNQLITGFSLQEDVTSRQENLHGLLQEPDRDIKGANSGADSFSVRDSLADMQRGVSVIRAALDVNFKRIQSKLEKMVEKVKQPRKRPQSDQ
jgi:hypothetical protein